MEEEDFLKLSPKEQDKLLAFRESEIRLANAKKWKAIFERAPPDTIPFIIYCTEVIAVLVIALFHVFNFEGNKFYFGLAVIFCGMFFPLIVLPGKSWKSIWRWFKEDIRGKKKN